ncbi:phosphatidate phosphatase LPIN3 [Anopheles ziemanni]|uniref:phosphatidate phosphatase LPIN3 n=1 Tax=Anopheles coustani TaxID=139045 RepID=UPI00265AA87C|nr:phosphatidate phosphatase LPIN3 [Anopheles coustani]XP_058167328.1 phosphatidate phosphatase LPIN3 [Anopheles ziemanni]
MNSLVSLFSNVKEFYSEINGATLTGAIDVVVVEQPDGSFVSSPFHVRFGKLGVLRSREKVVDIEVNGEPVELQMKLGESGEAFFVEECAEDDSEVPAHMATSPIPTHSYLTNYEGASAQGADGPIFKPIGAESGAEGQSSVVGPVDAGEGTSMMMIRESDGAAVVGEEEVMPRPRRNSVDLSNENAELERVKYENQRSEYSHRRHTDNVTNRPDLSLTKKEYTMQKLRQEWVAAAEAAEQEQIFHMEGLDDDSGAAGGGGSGVDWKNSTPLPGGDQSLEDKHFKPIDAQPTTTGSAAEVLPVATTSPAVNQQQQQGSVEALGDSKSKKKRRKKSLMKKKNTQRKNSTSSSSGGGSNHSDPNEGTETSDSLTASQLSGGSPKDTGEDNAALLAAKEKESSIKEGSETPEPSSAPGVTAPIPAAMSSSHHAELDVHFFSDTDVGLGTSPQQSRPSTPIQSDTEFEMSQREKPVTEDQKLLYGDAWNWGELPTTQSEAKAGGDPDGGKQAQHNSMLNGLMSLMKYNNKKKRQSVPDGLYLSDLDKVMEPEIAKLYFPPLPIRKQKKDEQQRGGDGGSGEDEDRESGNGTSIPQSPTSMEDGAMLKEGTDSDFDDHHHHQRQTKTSEADLVGQSIDTIAISLCGGLDTPDGPSEEQFDRARLQYSNVLADPSVFGSPDLVVRINGKYYSWAVACPQVMTMLAFQKALPTELLDSKKGGGDGDESKKQQVAPEQQQQQQQQAQQPQPNVGGRWWYWRRSNESKPAPSSSEAPPLTPSTPTAANELGMDGVDGSKASSAVATQTSRSNSPDEDGNAAPGTAGASAAMDASPYKTATKAEDGYNGSLSSEDSELVMEKSHQSMMDNSNDKALALSSEKYRKTLRLSSERIHQLNLQDGINEIEFSVTTAYQGTTRCKCYLFKWKHSDKVVISDIDGTITKSDVLGHILPMVGKSWDQIGVAQLFSKIEENGYKMLYLSARAIGQAKTTRGYLQSIRQGDVKLPDGPLLLNPTSLMSAFHREVIEKKPEQFKIACLNDIRDLFPDRNPFYAGYGNRINDVWAYRAVGIPTSRIFTINPKGELKHELTQTFQSTYANMAYIVDQLYPPIKHIEEEDNEYTSFNYWREPVPEIDFDGCDISGSSSNGSASGLSAASEKLSPSAATIVQQALPTIPEN